MSFEQQFTSPDKRARSDVLTKITNDKKLPANTKYEFLKKALLDSDDIVRSRAVELLSNLPGLPKSSISDTLMTHIFEEKYWGVRYLILKKFASNLEIWDSQRYREHLLKLAKDLKPQVRILTAQLLAKRYGEWEAVFRMYYDKDAEVRKEIQSLLGKSPDPQVQIKIAEIERRIREKEEKTRSIRNMFEGI